MLTILIGLAESEVTDSERVEIARLAPDAHLIITDDRERILTEIARADIIAGSVVRPMVPQATSLRWYQQWSAGSDWLAESPEQRDRDFLMTSTSGIHAIGISEHLVAMMLALVRKLPEAHRAQRERSWPHMELMPSRLAGKTLLLAGVGAIGERTAQIAHALGMRVIGIRRNPARSAEGVDVMEGSDELNRWLPEADFVALTLPLTDDTFHFIGEEQIALMRHGAYLLNIGRGNLVDEDALIAALQQGRIAGAALDVFEREPLPVTSPLWEMENVIVTPHYAGSFPEYNREAMAIFLENLKRFLARQPLMNLVDKRLGY